MLKVENLAVAYGALEIIRDLNFEVAAGQVTAIVGSNGAGKSTILRAIAGFARGKNFDLILTGMQSQDRGSAQVGAILAELLGISCVTTVVDFAFADGVITAKRELEGGMKAVVKLKPPAMITCQLGLNTPRYPTLPNIMKAKKKELLAVPVDDFLQEKELTATASAYPPAKKGTGLVLEGDVNDMAGKLIDILKEKTKVVK